MRYFLYNSSGQITCTTETPSSLSELRSYGNLVISAEGEAKGQYVDVDEICLVSMPSQPSTHHTFNYATKQWEDPRTLQDAKTQAWERIKAARSIAEVANFTCDGSVYQTDVERISGAVQLALLAQLGGQPFSIDWTLLDNTIKALDAAGMIAVGVAQGNYIKGVFDTGRILRDAINAATTIVQLDAIIWPT